VSAFLEKAGMDFSLSQFLSTQRYFCFSWSLRSPSSAGLSSVLLQIPIHRKHWLAEKFSGSSSNKNNKTPIVTTAKHTGYVDVINFASNA
jgi:hypothetical protein